MTFMRQDPDWTLPGNSLNTELYYKNHLDLIENRNMKLSKIIIETLQDVLSPQSPQSSSYLSQSSLIRSPPSSSLPKSKLLSAQPLSKSSLSQSLSATGTPFNPKHQITLHKSPTAPPKSQTIASPPFRQDFPSSLKTNSDHVSPAKPTKLIPSPTSASSSSFPPSSQIQVQPPSNISLPLLSTVTFPYTLTFPSFSIPTPHSLFSAPPSTSCHYLVPHPPSKVLPATPDSSLHVAQHVTEEVQISPAVPQVACGLMHLNLLAETTGKFLLVCILFLLFYTTFNFYLVFYIFRGTFLTLCIKTYYTAFIIYHLSFLGKSFR